MQAGREAGALVKVDDLSLSMHKGLVNDPMQSLRGKSTMAAGLLM